MMSVIDSTHVEALLDRAAAAGFSPSFELDRRSEPRCLKFAVLQMQPLGEDLCPCGTPVPAVLLDVSPHGIGLLASIPQEGRFFRVRWTGGDQNRPSLYELVHRRSIGSAFRIGGRPMQVLT